MFRLKIDTLMCNWFQACVVQTPFKTLRTFLFLIFFPPRFTAPVSRLEPGWGNHREINTVCIILAPASDLFKGVSGRSNRRLCDSLGLYTSVAHPALLQGGYLIYPKLITGFGMVKDNQTYHPPAKIRERCSGV